MPASSRIFHQLNLIIEKGLADSTYILLMFLFRILPEETGYRFARIVGYLYRLPILRPRVQAMMRYVIDRGDWSRQRAQKLWKEHLDWIGHAVIETFYWERYPIEVLRRRIEVKGKVHLDNALASGKGVILFTCHLSNFLTLWVQSACWAKEAAIPGNLLLTRYIEKRFSDFHAKCGLPRMIVGEGSASKLRSMLKRNGIVGLFVDLTTVKKYNAWVPFGRGEAKVNLGPAWLALSCRVQPLCLTTQPLTGNRYLITIYPPLELPKRGDLNSRSLQLTRQAIQVLETEICSRPAQWWQWDSACFRSRRT